MSIIQDIYFQIKKSEPELSNDEIISYIINYIVDRIIKFLNSSELPKYLSDKDLYKIKRMQNRLPKRIKEENIEKMKVNDKLKFFTQLQNYLNIENLYSQNTSNLYNFYISPSREDGFVVIEEKNGTTISNSIFESGKNIRKESKEIKDKNSVFNDSETISVLNSILESKNHIRNEIERTKKEKKLKFKDDFSKINIDSVIEKIKSVKNDITEIKKNTFYGDF